MMIIIIMLTTICKAGSCDQKFEVDLFEEFSQLTCKLLVEWHIFFALPFYVVGELANATEWARVSSTGVHLSSLIISITVYFGRLCQGLARLHRAYLESHVQINFSFFVCAEFFGKVHSPAGYSFFNLTKISAQHPCQKWWYAQPCIL